MKRTFMLLLPVVMMAIAGKTLAQISPNSLPVTVSINANLTGENKVAISWTILIKLSTDCFDVEKSNDGINWRSIATIQSKDSTVPFTYTVLDATPLKGVNFYKVRRKDMNGNYTFTAIKNVRVNALGRINIYPNPSSNTVNIFLGQVPRSDWSISIINGVGQLITQKKYTKNITAVTLPVHNYPAGNYILEIAEDDIKKSNKFMITHH